MRSLLTLTAVAICLLPRPTLAEPEVTFEHDVMAVLSKAGCNSGACHGNFRGKGDLRLSLRGQDPMQDYLALVQDLAARRINRAEPSHSLLLQKPLALVPHQGGKRFDVGSLPESILRAWLRQGAPPPRLDAMGLSGLEVQPAGPLVQVDDRPIKLRVTAHFADGTRRDVTRLANYETSNFLAQVSY